MSLAPSWRRKMNPLERSHSHMAAGQVCWTPSECSLLPHSFDVLAVSTWEGVPVVVVASNFRFKHGQTVPMPMYVFPLDAGPGSKPLHSFPIEKSWFYQRRKWISTRNETLWSMCNITTNIIEISMENGNRVSAGFLAHAFDYDITTSYIIVLTGGDPRAGRDLTRRLRMPAVINICQKSKTNPEKVLVLHRLKGAVNHVLRIPFEGNYFTAHAVKEDCLEAESPNHVMHVVDARTGQIVFTCDLTGHENCSYAADSAPFLKSPWSFNDSHSVLRDADGEPFTIERDKTLVRLPSRRQRLTWIRFCILFSSRGTNK